MFKIAIIGAKNSGKTTLTEELIKALSENSIRVMSIKHTSHQHSFDQPGKDTERHRKAGTKLTLGTNPSEFALFAEHDKSLFIKIEKLIQDSFHICLVEGDKFSDIPKILLTRNIEKIDIEDIQNILATYGDNKTNLSTRHYNVDEVQSLVDFLRSQIQQQTSIRTTS